MKRSDFIAAILACVFVAPVCWIAGSVCTPVPNEPAVVPVVVETDYPSRDVVVGELITLVVEGDDVAWEFSPSCEDNVSVDEGDTRLFVSFRHAGPHAIYAGASLDGKASITRFDFNVTRGPGPDPGPEPGPEPGPNPTPVEDEWVTRLRGWTPGPRPEAVSKAFVEVASWSQGRLDNSQLVTPQQILARTKTAVNKSVGQDGAKWRPFFAGLADHLAAESGGNALVTQRDYIRTWQSIGTALGKL